MQERQLFTAEGDPAKIEETGPTGPVSRVRLLIAYDGTDFRGLAPNPGVRTVVGELQRVLSAALGYSPEIVMSGRTDAGVHAAHQVLSFDVPESMAVDAGLEQMQRMLNARLGPEIVARSVDRAPSDFSARFDASGRSYRYRVFNREIPDPTMARYAWHVGDPLDLALMRLACDPIIGEHDFSSFCRRPKVAPGQEPASLVRRIDHATWEQVDGGVLEFSISGSAFCHQMVRSLVGFHVSVGRGRRTAGEILGVLRARDRQLAEQPAPPHGLHLVNVSYVGDAAFGA